MTDLMNKCFSFLLLMGFSCVALSFSLEAQTTLSGDHVITGNLDVGISGTAKNLNVTGTAHVSEKVGIGIVSPSATLEVAAEEGNQNGIAVFKGGYVTSKLPLISIKGSRGTISAPLGVQSGDPIGGLFFDGYTSAGYTGNLAAGIRAFAAQTYSSTAKGSQLAFETTPLNTAVRTEVMRITDIGNVGIGTGQPTSMLHLSGSAKDIGLNIVRFDGKALRVNAGTQAASIRFDNSGRFDFQATEKTNLINGWAGTSVISVLGNGNVGIGTTTPSAKLDVNGDVNVSGKITVSGTMQLAGTLAGSSLSGVVFGGTYGSGSIPMEDAGTRMMWYPGKAAFRAGEVSGTQWTGTFVGSHSVAFGSDSIASGECSTALGQSSNAAGYVSVAFGELTRADGPSSVAFGFSCTASGSASTAFGVECLASGDYSLALGSSTEATGYAAVSLGEATLSTGSYAAAMGYESQALSEASVAMGHATIAYGDYTVAMGQNTSAKAFASVAIGSRNVGVYDYANHGQNVWIPTDAIFEVGNGTEESKNAMTLFKNGNLRTEGFVEAKAGVRTAPQGDLSMGEFTAGNNPADLDPTTGLRYSGE